MDTFDESLDVDVFEGRGPSGSEFPSLMTMCVRDGASQFIFSIGCGDVRINCTLDYRDAIKLRDALVINLGPKRPTQKDAVTDTADRLVKVAELILGASGPDQMAILAYAAALAGYRLDKL